VTALQVAIIFVVGCIVGFFVGGMIDAFTRIRIRIGEYEREIALRDRKITVLNDMVSVKDAMITELRATPPPASRYN